MCLAEVIFPPLVLCGISYKILLDIVPSLMRVGTVWRSVCCLWDPKFRSGYLRVVSGISPDSGLFIEMDGLSVKGSSSSSESRVVRWGKWC